jgi:RHS repeat-associated protein
VHKDHLGSTRLLTKVDKTPLETPYDYLPYSEPIGPSGSGTTKKFTGKERDSETGLDYFGARYYVSLMGRFLNADIPFIDQRPDNPQSWNLFHFARNNPLNLIDPTGHAAEGPPYAQVETGGAMKSFGNSTCMRCEAFLAQLDIQEAFAPFDAYRQAAKNQTLKSGIQSQPKPPCRDQSCYVSPISDSGDTVDPLAIFGPGAVERKIEYAVFDEKGNRIKGPVEIKMVEEPENKNFTTCPPPKDCSNKDTPGQSWFKSGTFTDVLVSRGRGSASFTEKFFVSGGAVPVVWKDGSGGSVQRGWTQTVSITPKRLTITVNPRSIRPKRIRGELSGNSVKIMTAE